VPQETVDLFIEPHRGLTSELLYHAQRVYTTDLLVHFSGLHGRSIMMDRYESILVVASGFDIAAYLPNLKQLDVEGSVQVAESSKLYFVESKTHSDRPT
jgi:hypothetical protein